MATPKKPEIEVVSSPRPDDGMRSSVPEKPEPKPAPEPEKPHRYRIAFRDCPTLVIEAQDRADAWEKYQKHCGILGTANKPEIQKLE